MNRWTFSTLCGLLLGASGIYQQCLYLKDLFDFFEMKDVWRSVLCVDNGFHVISPVLLRRYAVQYANVRTKL